MKVIKLKRNPDIYTCNSYLVLGSWNRIEDVNTLVDVGSDGYIIDEIENINTGLGKKQVDQVVITHGHYDHAAGLPAIISKYRPVVYGAGRSDGVDRYLKDGDRIRMGDNFFEVLHVPTHSEDSILLYCAKEGVLFCGDTTLYIRSSEGTYDEKFLETLEYLAGTNIKTIYHGHDDPIVYEAKAVLLKSLKNIRNDETYKELGEDNYFKMLFSKYNLEVCDVK